MIIPYAKYHALGNDFLVISRPAGKSARSWSILAQSICNRHTGVGADGLLIIETGKRRADVSVRVINADGSVAEKSGNGLRITGLHLARKSRRRSWKVLMGGVVSQVALESGGTEFGVLSADLGEPDFRVSSLPMISRHQAIIGERLRFGKESHRLVCLTVGNPHAVLPVSALPTDWRAIGNTIEHSRLFPRGTNVEFVRTQSRRHLRVKEWERGVGETSSSGTGACAAVCAMVMLGMADRDCRVQFDGGTLGVRWDAKSNHLFLSGPVVWVTDGRYNWVC